MNERPKCGSCPHRIGHEEQTYDGRDYAYAVVHRCSAVPYPVGSDSPQVGEHDDGCIHHPDMPAYVEAWKREVKA